MRFFHLSDLHIGIKLHNLDLRKDQEDIFEQIINAAKDYQPEAVLIAGDIYDRAIPGPDAVAMFDRFITGLTNAVPKAEIMIISGNHDSAQRLNVFRSVLGSHHIHMIGLPPIKADEHIEKVTMIDEFGEVDFWLLPFVKPPMVRETLGLDDESPALSYDKTVRALLARENINTERRNVLVSHQFYIPSGSNPEDIERMDSEILSVGNIDSIGADMLQPFDYAALGHIHKPMKVSAPQYNYCGTPFPYSVSEAGQQKGINLVEIGEKGSEISITKLPLKPLHQVRVIKDTLDNVLSQTSDDYVLVVLTDKKDLDVIDMRERVQRAFPNLLNIKREFAAAERKEITAAGEGDQPLDPFSICKSFIGELDEETEEILKAIIDEAIESEKGVE